MKVKIKRIDNNFPLPEYHTSGAVGFDIYTRDEAVVQPGEIKKLRSNLVIETPKGYMLLMASRSSLPTKTGLVLANSVGIFDNDFCGENDEMIIQVMNVTDTEVSIAAGQRIAQGIFVPIETAEWEEVSVMTAPNRGGLGTTGK